MRHKNPQKNTFVIFRYFFPYAFFTLACLQLTISGMNPSIGVQFALNIGQAMQGLRYLSLAEISQRYNMSVPLFIEQSKASSSLDWAVFQAIQSNALDITFDSYMNTMGAWATKTTTINSQSVPISQVYYPQLFKTEQSANLAFEMPVVSNVSSQLSALMASERNRKPLYHSLPIFNYESNKVGAELKFSINVTQAPSRASYYSQIYNEIKNTQRQAIINSPQLLHAYRETVRTNAKLLRTMVLGESAAERIKAQLSVNQLDLINLFEEGEVLTNVKSCIQNFLLQDDYISPAFTLEQRGKLLEMSAPFFKEASKALQEPGFYIDFINECVAQNIPGAQVLLERHTGKNSWGDKATNFFTSFLPEYRPQNLDEKFNQNTFIKDYLRLENCCKSQHFSESQSILDSYASRLMACSGSGAVSQINNEVHALKVTHDHYYRQAFNEYGIRYEHTDDPYYVVAKQLLTACPLEYKKQLVETVQQTIAVRQEKMAQLFSTLKTDGKNAVVRAYAYRLIDAQTPQEVVTILASLSSDHTDANFRAAYDVFVANCAPKWISASYQSQVDIPSALSLEANTKARILYGNCIYLEPHSKEQEVRVGQIVEYLSQSCADQKQSTDYVYLAEKLYQSVHANAEGTILQCPNFNTAFTNPEQIGLKSELVSLTVDCLKKIEEMQAKDTNASDMGLIIQDIGKVFTAVKERKLQKAHAWIEKVIKPAINQGSITPAITHNRNSLIVREILYKCNAINEDTPFPQCFIPENKELIFLTSILLMSTLIRFWARVFRDCLLLKDFLNGPATALKIPISKIFLNVTGESSNNFLPWENLKQNGISRGVNMIKRVKRWPLKKSKQIMKKLLRWRNQFTKKVMQIRKKLE